MSSSTTDTDKAITLMLYVMRSQLFLDGNKRVGTLVCNQILVAGGRGVFSLPPELKTEFSEQLVHYYESGDMNEIKHLITTHCLIGL